MLLMLPEGMNKSTRCHPLAFFVGKLDCQCKAASIFFVQRKRLARKLRKCSSEGQWWVISVYWTLLFKFIMLHNSSLAVSSIFWYNIDNLQWIWTLELKVVFRLTHSLQFLVNWTHPLSTILWQKKEYPFPFVWSQEVKRRWWSTVSISQVWYSLRNA